MNSLKLSYWTVRLIGYLWAAPNTCLGLLVGGLGLLTGGRCQIRQSCIEFYGGLVTWLLNRTLLNQTMAMTLGHTILGINRAALDICRAHEQVHVRQYERWGVMFLPAYLGWSAVLWWQGKDFYRDNPFEVEAYADDQRRRSDGSGR